MEAIKTNSSFLHYAVMKQAEPSLDDKKRFKIQCQFCNTGPSELSKWTFVQKRWYEQPHGCMGGDCWHDQRIDLCDIRCPYCKEGNYLYNHKQKNEILQILKGFSKFSSDTLFKEVVIEE